MKKKIHAQIVKHVEAYRASNKNRKACKVGSGGIRAYQMQMDRAAGALDALFELDPTNPAWTETRWIN